MGWRERQIIRTLMPALFQRTPQFRRPLIHLSRSFILSNYCSYSLSDFGQVVHPRIDCCKIFRYQILTYSAHKVVGDVYTDIIVSILIFAFCFLETQGKGICECQPEIRPSSGFTQTCERMCGICRAVSNRKISAKIMLEQNNIHNA